MERPLQHNGVSRMDIPSPGGATFVVLYSAFLAFFVAVAVFNLVNFEFVPLYASILSVFWLLIVALGVSSGILENHGLCLFVVNRLGAFSSHHFVEINRELGDDPTVCFGFTLLTCRFKQFQIPSTAIASVAWHFGQSSAVVGYDMDDWQVFLRYHWKRSNRWTDSGYREEASYLVGAYGAKSETVELGQTFVAFLCSAGIELNPTPDECEFIVDKQESAAAELVDGNC